MPESHIDVIRSLNEATKSLRDAESLLLGYYSEDCWDISVELGIIRNTMIKLIEYRDDSELLSCPAEETTIREMDRQLEFLIDTDVLFFTVNHYDGDVFVNAIETVRKLLRSLERKN